MLLWYIITAFLFIASATLFYHWQHAQRISIEARTQAAQLHIMLKELEQVRDVALQNFQQEKEFRHQAETARQLANREVERMHQQMQDWEQTKQQHMEAARASMMKASMELSSKLLDDHKREAAEQQKQTHELMQNTTESIFTKYKGVVETMGMLQEQVKALDVVRNALLNPAGAGALGEITLENILRASHLIEEQDYSLQFTTGGADGRLRPDALIFLPQQQVLVIDSKASKYFIEREQAAQESPEALAQLDAKWLARMKEHVATLTRKDYREAVSQHFKEKRGYSPSHVTMLMFIPSDSALDMLRQLDPQFLTSVYEQMIIPTGPSGLMHMLLQSRMSILTAQQMENTHTIMQEVQGLLASIATLHDHASTLGKAMKSVVDKYGKFAASFNRTFLSKARKMQQLGVDSPKSNQHMQPLEQYQLIGGSAPMIEGTPDTPDDSLLEFTEDDRKVA